MKTSSESPDSDRALRHLCELAVPPSTRTCQPANRPGGAALKVKATGRPRPWRALAVGFGLAAAAAAVVLLVLSGNQTPPSLGFRVVDEARRARKPRRISPQRGASSSPTVSRVTLAAETPPRAVTAINARGASIRLSTGSACPHNSCNSRRRAGPSRPALPSSGDRGRHSTQPGRRTRGLWSCGSATAVFWSRGPTPGQGLAVVAGQHLLASATTGQIVLDAMAPAAPSALPVVLRRRRPLLNSRRPSRLPLNVLRPRRASRRVRCTWLPRHEHQPPSRR